jgi:hypothetical protein
MDRGIATAPNIALMQSLGFPFVVVERAAKEHDYLPVFEKEQASFERLETFKTNYARFFSDYEICAIMERDFHLNDMENRR